MMMFSEVMKDSTEIGSLNDSIMRHYRNASSIDIIDPKASSPIKSP